MFPVALAALSMLLSEAEQGLFFQTLSEGWCSLLGCQGLWKLLDPSGREELGGAEEFPVSGWGVSPDVPSGATADHLSPSIVDKQLFQEQGQGKHEQDKW